MQMKQVVEICVTCSQKQGPSLRPRGYPVSQGPTHPKCQHPQSSEEDPPPYPPPGAGLQKDGFHPADKDG